MTAPITQSRNRWGAIAGLVFVVLFVVGMLMSGNTPEYNASDREWIRWFRDDGNTGPAVIAMFLLVLSVFALLCFLAVLTRRLRLTNRRELVNLAIGAGLVLVAMIIVGGIAANQVSAAIQLGSSDGDYPVPGAD